MDPKSAFSFRPARPEEAVRAEYVASVALCDLVRSYTGGVSQFFVLLKKRPVERIVGVVVWGEKQFEPGAVCFDFALPHLPSESLALFLEAFRQFILQQNEGRYRQIHSARLFPREDGVFSLLESAGFQAGLCNQRYNAPLDALRDRINAIRASPRFRGIDPSVGRVITGLTQEHFTRLVHFCSQRNYFLSPRAIALALADPDRPDAAFTPSISSVYVEDGVVRGVVLLSLRNGHLNAPALAADPDASASRRAICYALFERVIDGLYALPVVPEKYHLNTDPNSHPSTVHLMKRTGGNLVDSIYRAEVVS